MAAAEDLASRIQQTAGACRPLGVSRATLYRRRTPQLQSTRSRPRSHRALEETERDQVLDVLRSPRFVDRSPEQAYGTLLDEDVYYCSIRTMYRILSANGEVRERRNQLRHPAYTAPELLAELPNEVWTWDISKLRGPAKWTYYYLYVILDIFSRYVVGWMVAHSEGAELARRLITETCRKQNVKPDQLTIHADRGASMTSKSVALLLSDLGVVKSHSRPHVSNDNPFSEAHFKTMKYCPQFPARFGCIQDARSFCSRFFDYYNNDHRHSGIGLMTPAVVHHNQADRVTAARRETLSAAYRAHPERFAKPPQPPVVPKQVWINPPAENSTPEDAPESTIVTLRNPWDPAPSVATTGLGACQIPLSKPATVSAEEAH